MVMRIGLESASGQRVAVERRVAAGGEMLQLALDVGQQAGGTEAEEVGLEPAAAELPERPVLRRTGPLGAY